MITKTEYLECKRYLHLADNNALNNSDKLAKVGPFFNAIKENCILNYQPTQHVSVDESMVPYFGKHGTKKYILGKLIKFRFKLWVVATPVGYCIQFGSYTVKDSVLQDYENIGLRLGASVVVNLVRKLAVMQTSKYHIAMDNFFTSPAFLRYLSATRVATRLTVRANQMENHPL